MHFRSADRKGEDVKTRVVIRNNATDETIELIADLDKKDIGFINETGERVAQGTDWDVTLVAVEGAG